MRIWGCSIAALAVGIMPAVALAQTSGAGQQTPAREQTPAIGVVPEQTPVTPTAATNQQLPTGGSGQTPPSAETAAADAPADDGGDIVVTGQLEGAVQGNPRPEFQLDPSSIQSYSATSVGELLDQISGQLGVDQAPVILLSGRVSSAQEVQRLPKEVIGRIDVLSEDVAVRLGYSSNQKVINIVLRRIQLLTAQFEGQAPTEGGVAGGRVSENLTKIMGPTRRLSLDGSYWETSNLFESERGVSRDSANLAYDLRGNVVPATGTEVDPALSTAAGKVVTIAGVPEAAAGGRQPLSAFATNGNTPNITNNGLYRTLNGVQRRLELNANYAREVSDTVNSSISARFTASENGGYQGLPNYSLRLPAGNPFSPFSREVRVLRYYDDVGPQRSQSRNQNFNLNGQLNGQGAFWASTNANWDVQGTFSRSSGRSRNDRGVDPTPLQNLLNANNPTANPFADLTPTSLLLRPDDTTESHTTNGRIRANMRGPLFELPAGNANMSVTLNGQIDRQDGRNVRSGILTNTNRSQESGSASVNLELPITSKSRDVLGAIGDFSVNGNLTLEQVQFGTLTSTRVGARWTPLQQFNASVSWSSDTNAPNVNNLSDPITITPNVRAFDYVRGESVDITRITGGNPNLVQQSSNSFQVQFNLRPFTINQGFFNITGSYRNNRQRNGIQQLPGINAEVQAAFPERFTRDASGRLTAVDARPINIVSDDYKELRFGLNFTKNLPSPSQQRLQEQRQREAQAFRTALEESRRTGQPLPPEFTARMEEMRRQQQQQSIFGNRGGPGQGQNRGFGQGQNGQGGNQGQGQNQAQGQGQNQAQGQAQNQGQGQGQGGGRFGGGGFGGGGFGGGGFGGGGGGRGGGGFGGRGGGGGGNSVRFNLTYVRVLEDQKLIRAGVPVLDSLNGASGNSNALNNSFGEDRWGLYSRSGFGRGGGTSRDNVQAGAAINYESYLLQLDTRWVSSSFVNTGALGSTTRLNYDAIAKVDLTTQINFSRQFNTIRKIPFLQGASVILNVDNLLNKRRRVTDQNGVTPTNQDPRLLDPIGRLIRVTFRKQFR